MGGIERCGSSAQKILFIPFILFILSKLLSFEPWDALDGSLAASRDARGLSPARSEIGRF